tara:strand:+ start:239 stop:667 length:429 start_codon:yes stop_codon:yes gene_type:complete
LKKKISDKDQKDWADFISKNEKLSNKDNYLEKNKIFTKTQKIIDLHGFSLEKANQLVEKFILDCFEKGVNKITVITGKGLRSKSVENPYLSKDLSILRYSVPEFIKSRKNLIKFIKTIKEADNQHGGSGAFYIFLKKNKNEK